MATTLRLGETFRLIRTAVYEHRLFVLQGNDLVLFPGTKEGEWRLGRLRRPDESRTASKREVQHYMTLLAPQLSAREARYLFWKDLSSDFPADEVPNFLALVRAKGERVDSIPSLVGRLLPNAERRPAG